MNYIYLTLEWPKWKALHVCINGGQKSMTILREWWDSVRSVRNRNQKQYQHHYNHGNAQVVLGTEFDVTHYCGLSYQMGWDISSTINIFNSIYPMFTNHLHSFQITTDNSVRQWIIIHKYRISEANKINYVRRTSYQPQGKGLAKCMVKPFRIKWKSVRMAL